MKKALRLLAFVMCIVMTFCTITQTVFAVEVNDKTEELPQSEEVTTEAYVIGEDYSRRDQSSKTYRKSDGLYVLVDYGKPVHYSDNGAWEDYDNRLVFAPKNDEDEAGYIVSKSDISVRLAEYAEKSNMVKVVDGSRKIGMSLNNASGKKIELYKEETQDDDDFALPNFSSGAIYRDVLDGVDLEYIIAGSDVKENIIIKTLSDKYEFSFELNLEGLVPSVYEDGSIYLKDIETDEIVMYIPNGYMYDAAGNASNNVFYSIKEESEGVYRFDVTADPEWINADERAFPITVDPTIVKYQTQYSGGRIKDTFIEEGHNESHGIWAWMNVGARNGYTNVSLIGIADAVSGTNIGLPSIPKTAMVVYAELRLKMKSTNGEDLFVGAYQVQRDWEADDASGVVPGCEYTVIDYITVNSSTSDYTLDITKAMIEWYKDNNLPKYGLALKTNSETEYVSFSTVNESAYNSTHPMFVISYRDTKGLQDIWQFISHGAGNAGTGYVNTFNGNLVFVHDDTVTKGNILPISVSHVYNSYAANSDFTSNNDILTSDFSNMKIGKGWKLSVQETIKRITLDNEYWYVYNDADGTELYFTPDTENGVHHSEDGYPLYLTVSSGTYKYILEDDCENCRYFDSNGRLVKITDAFGNARDYAYNSSGQLESITCTPKNGSSYTQLLFRYNSEKALYMITNTSDANDTVTFYYSETYGGAVSTNKSGYLRKIVSRIYGTCEFEYNPDGTLKGTHDNDTSYDVKYEYISSDKFSRISSVEEFANNEAGQKIGFNYSDRKTTVRTSGNNDSYNDADDILTTYIMDTYGKTVCSFSSDITGKDVYGTAYAKYTNFNQGDKKNNKITVDSVKGNTVENLLLNHNCESISNWTGMVSGSGYSSSASTADKLYGDKSFVMSSTNNSSGYYRRYQNVTIPESGTYTFSAYVKTANVSTANNGGAFIILDGSESERLTGTTNTNIQNGWQRISVTKTLSANTTVQVQLKLAAASGTVYFDCVQLEKSEVASDYNLIQNGGMSLSSGGWSAAPNYTDAERGKVMQVTGNASGYNYKSQTVALSVPKETTLMLSGWGKAESTPTGNDNANHNRTFRVVANIHYSDGTIQDQAADFNPYYSDWQYSSVAIIPEKDITSITVFLSYDFNCNDAYFDDICLTIEPAQRYEYYDEDQSLSNYGQIKKVISESGNTGVIKYDDDNVDVIQYTDALGLNYHYDYKKVDNVSVHVVDTVTKKDNNDNTTLQVLQYEYDTYGNTTKSTLSSPGVTGVVTSSSSYIENGNFLSTVTDSLGGITSYGYDSAKLLKYVQNANGNRTGYLYDSRNRNTRMFDDADSDGVLDSGEANVQYTYTNNRLTGITTGSTSYTLSYDSFGNMTQVKAGNNTLATYTYASGNGKLQRMTLGNGDCEEYTYDHLDRLISVKYNNVVTYTLTYDANGQIAKCVDLKAGMTHTYEYDGLGRLIRAWQSDTSTGVKTLGVENIYDEYGRADRSKYVIGDKTISYNLTYKPNSNLVRSLNVNNVATNYTYDNLDRLTNKSITFSASSSISEVYGYYGYTSGNTQYTTPLVSTLTFKKNSSTTATYSYTYDSLGNILTVSKNGSLLYAYEYDSLNQLVREDNVEEGKTTLFDYDNAGNITARHVFDYWAGCPTFQYRSLIGCDPSYEVVNYGYSNGAWGDLLTSYNGTTITYDAIGNPLNWRDGITNVTWDGRQLNSLVKGNYTYSYQYNADGIRTQKTKWYTGTSMAEITHYVLDGTKIVKEYRTTSANSTQTNVKYYFYDASGSIAGFEYNGNKYYFQKNIQGDILRICDTSGNTVAEYTYDAWGKILSIKDGSGNDVSGNANHIANINPFRYRGYYYDTETGFYYVSSRYYDPEIGRWINADGQISGVGGDIRGYNLFAYCFNNPVNMSDPTGNWPSWGQVFAAVATVAVAAVFVAAVVASAGAVGVAAGVAAASIGATGTMVSAAITVGTVGTYAVAAGIGACALSNAGEILTGTNVIRDGLMGGNQEAYDTVQTALNIAGGGAMILGQTNPGVTGNAAKPSQNAQTVHKVPTTGTPNTSFDKLYSGNTGGFQRTYYDFKGNVSLQIDFTYHNNPSIHSNPHLHIWGSSGRGNQINLWYLE